MPETPQETPQETPRSGFTLDLSSGASGRPKRPKGFVPVVQKTINLTTKKAEPTAEPTAESTAEPGAPAQPARSLRRSGADRAEPAQPEPTRSEATRTSRPDPRRPDSRREEPRREDPRRSGPKQQGPKQPDPRDAPRPSGGTSLADLLDEATLARLRGA